MKLVISLIGILLSSGFAFGLPRDSRKPNTSPSVRPTSFRHHPTETPSTHSNSSSLSPSVRPTTSRRHPTETPSAHSNSSSLSPSVRPTLLTETPSTHSNSSSLSPSRRLDSSHRFLVEQDENDFEDENHFSSNCPLHPIIQTKDPKGTIRDISSTPSHNGSLFDPILVGWLGQYSPGRVIQEKIFPTMLAYVSLDQGESFVKVNDTTISDTTGRLVTVAKFGSTVIAGGQLFPGGSQVLFHSSDGGLSFTRSFTGQPGVIYGSCLVNQSVGYAVGSLMAINRNNNTTPQLGIAFRTEDGGSSWNVVDITSSTLQKVNFRGVSCIDSNVIVAGSVDDTQAIWSSSDEGKTFSDPQLCDNNVLYDISATRSHGYLGFPNSHEKKSVVLAVGGSSPRSSSSSTILRSENGGDFSVVHTGSGILFGVLAHSEKFALAVGVSARARAVILRSTDGGSSWKRFRPTIGFDVLYAVSAGRNSSQHKFAINDRNKPNCNQNHQHSPPKKGCSHETFIEPDRITVGGSIGTSGDGRGPQLVMGCNNEHILNQREDTDDEYYNYDIETETDTTNSPTTSSIQTKVKAEEVKETENDENDDDDDDEDEENENGDEDEENENVEENEKDNEEEEKENDEDDDEDEDEKSTERRILSEKKIPSVKKDSDDMFYIPQYSYI